MSFGKWQDERLPVFEGTCVSRRGHHGKGIGMSSSKFEVRLSGMYFPDNNELHGKTWVVPQPAHVGVAAKASPVRGRSALRGAGVEHDLVIMRRMAEGVATIAYRKCVSARPKDLISVARAEVGVVSTVQFKRVGEPFLGDHAPFKQG
eukprot:1145442-Pelagomonas_calceolata.AAC.1